MPKAPTFGESVNVPSGQISVPTPSPIAGNIAGAMGVAANLLSKADQAEKSARDQAFLAQLEADTLIAIDNGLTAASESDVDGVDEAYLSHVTPITDRINEIKDPSLKAMATQRVASNLAGGQIRAKRVRVGKVADNASVAAGNLRDALMEKATDLAVTDEQVEGIMQRVRDEELSGVNLRYSTKQQAIAVADAFNAELVRRRFEAIVDLSPEDAEQFLDKFSNDVTPATASTLKEMIDPAKDRRATRQLTVLARDLDSRLAELVSANDTEAIDAIMAKASEITSPGMERRGQTGQDRIISILQPAIDRQVGRGLEGVKRYSFLKAAMQRNASGASVEAYVEDADESMRRSTVKDITTRLESSLVLGHVSREDALASVEYMLEINRADPTSPFGATVNEAASILQRVQVSSSKGEKRDVARQSFKTGSEVTGIGQSTVDEMYADGEFRSMVEAEVGDTPEMTDAERETELVNREIDMFANSNLPIPTQMRESMVNNLLNIENPQAFEAGLAAINQVRLSSIDQRNPKYYRDSFSSEVLAFVGEYNTLSTAGPVSQKDAVALHNKIFPKTPAQQRNVERLQTPEMQRRVIESTENVVERLANDFDVFWTIDEGDMAEQLADDRNLSALIHSRITTLLAGNSDLTFEAAEMIATQQLKKDGLTYTTFGRPRWMLDAPENSYQMYGGDPLKVMNDFAPELEKFVMDGALLIPGGGPEHLPQFPETEQNPFSERDDPIPLTEKTRKAIVRDWISERLIFTRQVFASGPDDIPQYSVQYVDDRGELHPIMIQRGDGVIPFVWYPDVENGPTASQLNQNAERNRLQREAAKDVKRDRGKFLDMIRDASNQSKMGFFVPRTRIERKSGNGRPEIK